MFRSNTKYRHVRPISAWRTISLGSWRPTGDSSIHTELELEVGPVLRYLADRSRVQKERFRLTHFFGWALARALAEQPAINSVVRFGRVYERRDVDLFFHVAADRTSGEDLTGFVIRRADRLSLSELRGDYARRLAKIRESRDRRFDRVKGIFRLLPGALARIVLDFTGWLSYTLNVFHPALGIPRDAFGSVMITNIGALGIDMAFAPIAPYTRIPMVVAIGAVRQRPVVRAGQCIPRPTVRLGFTLDHRLIDGVHFARLANSLRRSFESPHLLDGAWPAVEADARPELQLAGGLR